MIKPRLLLAPTLTVLLLALAVACDGDGGPPTALTPTPTVERTDAEVILPDQAAGGFDLTDPSFEALQGAQALSGELGGTVLPH